MFLTAKRSFFFKNLPLKDWYFLIKSDIVPSAPFEVIRKWKLVSQSGLMATPCDWPIRPIGNTLGRWTVAILYIYFSATTTDKFLYVYGLKRG